MRKRVLDVTPRRLLILLTAILAAVVAGLLALGFAIGWLQDGEREQ